MDLVWPSQEEWNSSLYLGRSSLRCFRWFALLLLALFAQLFFSFISSMKAKERASWARRKKATNPTTPSICFALLVFSFERSYWRPAATNPPQEKRRQSKGIPFLSAGTAANQSHQSNKNKFNLFFFVDDWLLDCSLGPPPLRKQTKQSIPSILKEWNGIALCVVCCGRHLVDCAKNNSK